MDDLTAFISARLDEDEAAANAGARPVTALAAIWSDHPDYQQEWTM